MTLYGFSTDNLLQLIVDKKTLESLAILHMDIEFTDKSVSIDSYTEMGDIRKNVLNKEVIYNIKKGLI